MSAARDCIAVQITKLILLIIRIEERRFRYQSYVIYKNSFLIFFNIIRLNLCKTHGVSQ